MFENTLASISIWYLEMNFQCHKIIDPLIGKCIIFLRIVCC